MMVESLELLPETFVLVLAKGEATELISLCKNRSLLTKSNIFLHQILMCFLSEGKVRSGKFDVWTVYTVVYAHHNVSV